MTSRGKTLGDRPCWASTRYSVRPWDPNQPAPPLATIPFSTAEPERQLKRDPFHTLKVGIFRDHIASCICYMVHSGLFGAQGDFGEKLRSAHGSFSLWAKTVGKTASLRSFTRAFINYPSFEKFPWMNCKGSDSMLVMQWLVLQCAGFENDPTNGADREFLQIMKNTSQAALNIWKHMNSHGLFRKILCDHFSCRGHSFYQRVSSIGDQNPQQLETMGL